MVSMPKPIVLIIIIIECKFYILEEFKIELPAYFLLFVLEI